MKNLDKLKKIAKDNKINDIDLDWLYLSNFREIKSSVRYYDSEGKEWQLIEALELIMHFIQDDDKGEAEK